MERGSDKHGPRIDEQMQEEVQGALKANRPTRADEGREPEPLVNDDGRPATDPQAGLDEDERA
ncbi:hypothetical protein ACQEU5_09680 [Marinactinospora thermotolerans]|uniref:Uncharacterized protein n=1 Tax=Marinactinospora thermotolerans DSM 45154 TaxID=1122192 RepID=A0A1T4NB21_9ACTN|nr:hypothetical protein [Marinactinospora thermotolerans]SJZ76257.1 hypothetical protein SAMN02745673_01361 [Marinactinospora thermotolerans DSM 45154]